MKSLKLGEVKSTTLGHYVVWHADHSNHVLGGVLRSLKTPAACSLNGKAPKRVKYGFRVKNFFCFIVFFVSDTVK